MLATCKCSYCGIGLTESESYEYRGAIACETHFDQVCELRDRERQAIIQEESAKTEPLRGLDLGDTAIGRANRALLKGRIELARQESPRIKTYERR